MSATALVRNPVVVLREEFDDWAVLYNPDTAEAAGINPTGVAIWKLLDGRRGVEELVAALREGFAEVPGSVEAEVREFVARLLKGGFVGSEERDPEG